MFFSHTLYLRVLQGDSAYGPHGVYVPGEEVYVPGGARREGLARRAGEKNGEKNGNAPTHAAPGRCREGWTGVGYSLSAQLDFWVLFFWST